VIDDRRIKIRQADGLAHHPLLRDEGLLCVAECLRRAEKKLEAHLYVGHAAAVSIKAGASS
jgi:hypothetical protein